MKVTETKTTIIETIDGRGPDYGLVSIARSVGLVIGARYLDKNSSNFTKQGLGELIKILQELHDAMVDA